MDHKKLLEQESRRVNDLLSLIPNEQKTRVFDQRFCDIDGSFIGFIDTYESLSKLIPKHFTVIDLGCAYNPQCFYFREHKKYVAVDVSDCEKFKTDNCEIVVKSIENFIEEDLGRFELKETFAICNFVPPWGGNNGEMVRTAFKNCFVYYPHGECDAIEKEFKDKINNLIIKNK